LLPLVGMATKRPVLRTVPKADRNRGRRLEQEVLAIVRPHVEDACERAWADVARRFGTGPLLAKGDPTTSCAHRAVRALAKLLASSVTRLAVTALLLPSPGPARLRALPGGLRRDAVRDSATTTVERRGTVERPGTV
jgi:hypothetical protein